MEGGENTGIYEVWITRKAKHSVDDVRDHLLVRGDMPRRDAVSLCSQINQSRGDGFGQRTTAYYRWTSEPTYGINVEKDDLSSVFEVAYNQENADLLYDKYVGTHTKHATGCKITIVKISEESSRSNARVADTDMTYGEFMGQSVDGGENGAEGNDNNNDNDNDEPCMCPQCRVNRGDAPPIENEDSQEESSDEMPPLVNMRENPDGGNVWFRNPAGGRDANDQRRQLGRLMNGIIELIMQSDEMDDIVREYFECIVAHQSLDDLAARNQMRRGMLDYLVVSYLIRGLRT